MNQHRRSCSRRFIRCVASILFGALLAAQGPSALAQWAQYGADAAHSCVGPNVGPFDVGGSAVQSAAEGVLDRSCPIVHGGQVFCHAVVGGEPVVKAFNADTLATNWTSPALDAGVSEMYESIGSPAADDTGVYYATGAYVYKLRLDTGEAIWSTELTDTPGFNQIVNLCPTLHDGRLVLTTYSNIVFGLPTDVPRLYVLNCATGAVEWSAEIGGPGQNTAAVRDEAGQGVIYVATDGAIEKWNLDAPATRLWSTETSGAPLGLSFTVYGAVSVAGNAVYAQTSDIWGGGRGELVKVGAATGRLLWKNSGVESGAMPAIVRGGTVIIGGGFGAVADYSNWPEVGYAPAPSGVLGLDIATGQIRWERQIGNGSLSGGAMACAGTSVYGVASQVPGWSEQGPGAFALNASYGVMQGTPASGLAGSPSIGTDALYVNGGGRVHRFASLWQPTITRAGDSWRLYE